MHSSSRWLVAFAASAAIATGCGGASTANPAATFQGQVTIPIQVGYAEIIQGQIWAVTLNPQASYSSFLAAAGMRFGANPSRIEVRSASLRMLPSSAVANLEDVLTGNVTVSFTMAAPFMYRAASVTSPTGTGPAPLQVTFAPSSVSAMDMAHLCSGALDVYLQGRVATGFDPAPSSAPAQLELLLDLTAVE